MYFLDADISGSSALQIVQVFFASVVFKAFFLKIIWLHTSRSMCLFPVPNCQILRDLLPREKYPVTFLAQKNTIA